MKTHVHLNVIWIAGRAGRCSRGWSIEQFSSVLFTLLYLLVLPTSTAHIGSNESHPCCLESLSAEALTYATDYRRSLLTMPSGHEVKGVVAPTGPSFVSATRPQIILFGDSLTERSFDTPEGWGAALASFYVRRADVLNRGMSGYNTRWALQTLPYVFGPANASGAHNAHTIAQRVLFTTVLFGANDAARLDGPSHSTRQHVPILEYSKNLKEIVSYIKATGVDRVVLLTPPPVSDKGRKRSQIQRMGDEAHDWPLDRTFHSTAEYSRVAKEVAKEMGVPCLDLFTILQEEEEWEDRYLCDGLHFTPRGQERLWHELRSLLRSQWPDIRPVDLPAQFPAWDAINSNDIKSSFTATDAAS